MLWLAVDQDKTNYPKRTGILLLFGVLQVRYGTAFLNIYFNGTLIACAQSIAATVHCAADSPTLEVQTRRHFFCIVIKPLSKQDPREENPYLASCPPPKLSHQSRIYSLAPHRYQLLPWPLSSHVFARPTRGLPSTCHHVILRLQGFSLGSLVDLVLQVDPSILVTALLATMTVFVCFAGAALFAKRRSYLYLGGLLSSGLLGEFFYTHNSFCFL